MFGNGAIGGWSCMPRVPLLEEEEEEEEGEEEEE